MCADVFRHRTCVCDERGGRASSRETLMRPSNFKGKGSFEKGVILVFHRKSRVNAAHVASSPDFVFRQLHFCFCRERKARSFAQIFFRCQSSNLTADHRHCAAHTSVCSSSESGASLVFRTQLSFSSSLRVCASNGFAFAGARGIRGPTFTNLFEKTPWSSLLPLSRDGTRGAADRGRRRGQLREQT